MLKYTKFYLGLSVALSVIFGAVYLPKISAKQNKKVQSNPIILTSQLSPSPSPEPPLPDNSQANSLTVPAPQPAAKNTSSETAQVSNNSSQYPVSLRISSIHLIAPIVKTGLESDGSLHVPSSPDLSGWYDLGPKPGEIGPAVITGHLDSKYGPGVFINLKNVKVGDQIEVIRDDGSVAVFKVDKLEKYPQDNFATQAVYGLIPYPGLRIITCAGTYSKQTGHYSDDLVVYATLDSIKQQGKYLPL